MSFNNILWTRIYKLVEAKNTGIIKGGDQSMTKTNIDHNTEKMSYLI